MEKLATLLWRQRRFLKAESAEVEKGTQFIEKHTLQLFARLGILTRYEAHLDRAFDRTMNQLERLQRMRLGQPVLPPVKVELSS